MKCERCGNETFTIYINDNHEKVCDRKCPDIKEVECQQNLKEIE